MPLGNSDFVAAHGTPIHPCIVGFHPRFVDGVVSRMIALVQKLVVLVLSHRRSLSDESRGLVPLHANAEQTGGSDILPGVPPERSYTSTGGILSSDDLTMSDPAFFAA